MISKILSASLQTAAICSLASNLAVVAPASAELPESGSSAGHFVAVTGDSAAYLPPDKVRITIVLQDNSGALSSAGELLAKKEKAVVEAARRAAPDLKLLERGDRFRGPAPGSPLSLSSVATFERTITLETRQISAAGALAEAALKNGAQSIDEVDFIPAEDTAPFEQAIEQAAQRAKSKALAAARGLGVKLGEPAEVVVTEEPAGEAIQRDRELGRDPGRFSSREVRVYVNARYLVSAQ